MTTLENEFTTDAIATLVRESCDQFYGDDAILTDWVVEEFTKRLDEARGGGASGWMTSADGSLLMSSTITAVDLRHLIQLRSSRIVSPSCRCRRR